MRRSDCENPQLEHLVLELTAPRNGNIMIHMLYRPLHRTSEELEQFFSAFHASLQTSIPLSSGTIILGDFNAKVKAWGVSTSDDVAGLRLTSSLDDLGLLQLVHSKPTRYSATGATSSLLDLVITGAAHLLSNINVLDPVSDHSPVTLNLLWNHSPQKMSPQQYYDYPRTDFGALRASLRLSPLLECMAGAETVTGAWAALEMYILNAIATHIPLRTTKKHIASQPWYTPALHRFHKHKNRLFCKAKRSHSVEHWTAYKLARNAYQTKLRNAKKQYFQHMSSSLDKEGNSRAWWQKAKRIANINTSHQPIPDLVHNDSAVDSDLGKANVFAELFEQQCTPSHTTDNPAVQQLPEATRFVLQPLSQLEVYRALCKLPASKSTAGPVTNRILRECASVLAPSLTYLFNTSINKHELPGAWKIGTVHPLYKGKGSRKDASSYRPITLLPAISKLLDQLIASQFARFLQNNGIIASQQYGFVPNKSTVDQLIDLTTRIAANLDGNTPYDVAFLDFAKAFDKVPHPVLLTQLSSLCSASALEWFRGYLCGRSLNVKVRTAVSQMKPVRSGVPQGSHLGPLLFLVYINSLPSAIANSSPACNVYLFADDSTLGQKRTHPDDSSLSKAIEDASQWARAVGGTFNSSKTVVVPFSPSNKTFVVPFSSSRMNAPDPTLPQSEPANVVKCHRHLGVLLDSHLQFRDHIQHVTTSFRQKAVLLCYMTRRLTSTVIHRLYTTYVRPRAEYAAPIWHPHILSRDANALERIQARIARNILQARGERSAFTESKEELFRRADLPSLGWRRRISCLVHFFHVVHTNRETLEEYGYALSNSDRRPMYFLLPANAGNHTRSAFLHKTCRSWNSLPSSIRSMSSKKNFRTAIQVLFEDYKYRPSSFFCRSSLAHCTFHVVSELYLLTLLS